MQIFRIKTLLSTNGYIFENTWRQVPDQTVTGVLPYYIVLIIISLSYQLFVMFKDFNCDMTQQIIFFLKKWN